MAKWLESDMIIVVSVNSVERDCPVNVLPWGLEETSCLQMDITEDLVALNT